MLVLAHARTQVTEFEPLCFDVLEDDGEPHGLVDTTLASYERLELNGEPCVDVPTWTHWPPRDVYIQLFLLAVFLLGSSWVALRVLSWARQRGYCLCLCLPCCRNNYHGLSQKPDTAG